MLLGLVQAGVAVASEPALVIASPAEGAVLGEPDPIFSGTTEAPEPAALVSVEVSGGGSTQTLTGSPTGGTWTTGAAAPLKNGSYTAVATEAGMTPTSITFTVARELPTLTLDNVPSPTTNTQPTFGGSASVAPGATGVVGYVLKTEKGVEVERGQVPIEGGAWSFTPASALTNGGYTFEAAPKDELGNEGAPVAASLRVDTKSPAVSLTTPSSNEQINHENVTFSGAAGNELGDNAQITLLIYEEPEGGSPTLLQEVAVTRQGAGWISEGLELPPGRYSALATQTDSVGHTGVSAPHSFSVVTTAPVVTLGTVGFARDGSRLVTANPTPTLSTEPSAGIKKAHLAVYIGPSAAGTPIQRLSMSEGAGGSWAASAEHLSDGTYTAQVEVEDFAGNRGVSAPVVFIVDTTPPSVTLTAPVTGGTIAGNIESVAGTASNAEGDLPNVIVQVFSGAAIESQAPIEEVVVSVSSDGSWGASVGGLGDGTYTVRAEQFDDAGNRGASGPSTFTVTTPLTSALPAPPAPSPPSASFTWVPADPAVGQTVSLVSSSTDPSSAIGSFAWDVAGNGQFAPGGPAMTTSFATVGAHAVSLRVADGNGLSSTVTETIKVLAAAPKLMQPFPIVRIAGSETSFGASVRLLTVQAPLGAKVSITCVGGGCKTKAESRVAKASSKTGSRAGAVTLAFGRFERPLRAGALLQIRVTQPGEIGKFTSFAIRRHRLPVRTDACLPPSSSKPTACPSS